MIDFLFLDKGKCYFCKEEKIYKHYLCKSCLDKLDFVDNHFRLGSYQAHSIYFYNKFMAKIIGDYKFSRNTSLYKVFGSMVEDYLNESEFSIKDFPYLLPVPSSKKTINQRGFDHIKLICDYFIKSFDIAYLKDFEKIKNTKSQHTLSLEERMKNLNGAFSYKKNLEGENILVFDDIITSGNTGKEIMTELENKGAGRVEILSLSSSHKVI